MSHTNQFSISPIAAAVSAALVTPAAALAQEEGARDSLDEVIVYATKRAENVQDIPSTVQAIPESMLNDMGALNTEDYARFIPSLTFTNLTNDSTVTFRGVSTGASGFIGRTSASVYFDEISVTSTSQQPDIRMMDIARVEALAGPQGTLFGASAQSGTLRIITNQPDPSKFESSVDGQMRGGDTSDSSYSLTGVLNLPLVEDVFAIRIAAQTAEDGGYIDNVLGNTPDTWFGYLAGPNYGTYLSRTRLEWGTLDNAAIVEKDWNSVDILAARISARWNINDNWSATASYHYQETEAQASNDYNPFVGDLQTIAFAPNWSQDEWDVASLTIEADLGFAQFISATSFYDRVYDYNVDGTVYYKYYHAWGCEDKGDAAIYTGYWTNPVTNRAVYYPRYCIMPPSASGDPTLQADYVGVLEGPSFQDKFAQEFRLSHQGEKFDWLAGLYYEDSNDNWDAVFMKSTTGDYQDTQGLLFLEDFYSNPANCTAEYVALGNCQPGTTFPLAQYTWYGEDRTQWEQKAVFGEMTWHIDDDLELTVGGRWFETTNDKQILRWHAGYRDANGTDIGSILQPRSQPGSGGEGIAAGKLSEFVPKVALSWNVSDDKMLYGTYTEGFRPGGTNRLAGNVDYSRTFFPQVWEPDLLKNYEIGAKTRWADNTVQLNVSLFYMDWEDFQAEIVDPSFGDCIDPTQPPGTCGPAGSLPWVQVVGNAGDAHSSGVEAQLAWVPAVGWDIGANAQWLEAEIDEDLVTDPRAGQGITKGQRLPNVAEFKASAWATYTWPAQFMGGVDMFIRGQYSYTGDSVNLLIPERSSANPSHVQDSYAIADVRFGVVSNGGDWRLELFANNVTDERAQLYQNTGDFEWAFSHSSQYDRFHRVYTNRPREFGVRYFKGWGN